ncbi:hypothetical protein A5658_17655 [Mycobacterium sp. 1245111.1]|uniref:hypothetical protein n=1 Tax=Mycobacterium sp. 1245111.1 TaxID=1834073 RepID=UPI0008009779|nr:hypothetical protein [Mycobacterium sp. 1245111.1]OBK41714.1 hypothetical protein A5658_17655 [Mycobacterium sp. 1245111.1]
MHIRKVAAAAGFATGAALAFAPFASADPVEITSTVSSEIASMNAMFDFDSLLTGVPTADIVHGTAANPFDTILPSAVDTVQGNGTTPFDYLIYGVDPVKAGLADDPGSYNLFNGALGKFDDAYNVLLYASLNNGAIDPNDADFIGSATSIDHAQGLATATDAAQYFFNFGLGDLEGYFGIFPSEAASTAAADPAAVIDITPVLTSEVESLNGLFASDVASAGIPSTDIIQGSGPLPFDTIDTADTNAAFNALVFGAADPSGDPGSYDVFNGALTEFFNASNVGLFALLNGGDILPAADLFGPTDYLGDGVSTAIGEYLQLGFNDLLGYFLPAAASSMIP